MKGIKGGGIELGWVGMGITKIWARWPEMNMRTTDDGWHEEMV
jgi:hypothetical protein